MTTLASPARIDVTSISVPFGAAAHLVVEHLGSLIRCADAELTRARFTNETFTKPDPYRLPVDQSLGADIRRVRAELDAFERSFPDHADLCAVLGRALDAASSREWAGQLEDAYRAALGLYADAFEPAPPGLPLAEARFGRHRLTVDIHVDHIRRADAAENYLAAVAALIAHRREAEQNLHPDESIAVLAAYWLLDRGVHIAGDFPSWGTSGFRDVQTYASITDPGEGHLAGTTRDSGFLRGVIVHVEHLERGVDRSRDELEPYRIPSPRAVARARLHAGAAAPVSSYIGRPLFDGAVADSLIKTSRTFAAAASSLLADGLAEVKFAVERLTASEAITLLGALAREVRRDRYTQALAAAFNINTPILDDRADTVARHGAPVWVQAPEDIGLLGIEIAAAGGFDKVTWDGTADTYPSRCITDQLTAATALTLVHRAHELGLLTYFSAGFRFENIPDAVVTGVDGIGIGGAQILRFMDKETGNHGPFLPGNIHRILDIRDGAAGALHGRAAHLLARMDRMYFEGSIEADMEPARQALFEALRDRDDAGVRQLLEELKSVGDAAPDTQHPLLAWASRLIACRAPLAAWRLDAIAWGEYRELIAGALRGRDLMGLSDLLRAVCATAAPDVQDQAESAIHAVAAAA